MQHQQHQQQFEQFGNRTFPNHFSNTIDSYGNIKEKKASQVVPLSMSAERYLFKEILILIMIDNNHNSMIIN